MPENQVRYWENPQTEVFPKIINTICPIDKADNARLIAHQYMTTVESGSSMTVADMLPVKLAPLWSDEATHVFCSRDGFCHQARKQMEFMAARPEAWVAKTGFEAGTVTDAILGLFCCVIGDAETMLARLGLREVP